MVALTAIAMGIKLAAEYAPGIIGLFSKEKGEKAEKTAAVVTSLAESITGKTGEGAMEALSASPELQLRFQEALMKDSHIEAEMQYADRAHARDNYNKYDEIGNYAGKRIVDWNIKYMAGLVILYSVVAITLPMMFPENSALVGGIVGTIGPLLGGFINQLSKERSDFFAFLYGSSVGSKSKDSKGV